MRKVVLGISGMSCKHCVARVKGALEGLDGVSEVVVSLEDKTAEVTFDESKSDQGKLAVAVADAGYTVSS